MFRYIGNACARSTLTWLALGLPTLILMTPIANAAPEAKDPPLRAPLQQPMTVLVSPESGSKLIAGSPFELVVQTHPADEEAQVQISGQEPQRGKPPFRFRLQASTALEQPYRVQLYIKRLTRFGPQQIPLPELRYPLLPKPEQPLRLSIADCTGAHLLQARVCVTGFYADGKQRRLDNQLDEVSYRSSDTSIIAVAPDGVVTMGKPGLVVVTATAYGLSDRYPFRSPQYEGESMDVSSLVRITGGPLRLLEAPDVWIQDIQITPSTEQPVQLPVHLVLRPIAPEITARFWGSTGNGDADWVPLHAPKTVKAAGFIPLPHYESHYLWPGQTLRTEIVYENPRAKPFIPQFALYWAREWKL